MRGTTGISQIFVFGLKDSVISYGPSLCKSDVVIVKSSLRSPEYPPYEQPFTRPVRVSFEPVYHSPVIVQFIVVLIWHG